MTSKLTKKAILEKMYVSNGNKKLKSNDKIRFLIWNLPAVKTCPYSTPECRKNCYARKAEKCYKDALPCRNRNLEFTKSPEFVPYMIRLIEITLKSEKRTGRLVWLRIHESGDFYSQEYVDKWLEIINHFRGENIVFHAYTKSLPFFHNRTIPANLSFISSIWSDTKPEMIAETIHKGYKVYTAFPAGSFPADHAKCTCKDCAGCGWCIRNDYKKIACEIH